MIAEILQWSVLQVFAAFPSTNLQLACLAACQGDTCQFPVYDTRFNQSVNFIHISYVVKYTVNDRHLQACCFVSPLALLTLIYCVCLVRGCAGEEVILSPATELKREIQVLENTDKSHKQGKIFGLLLYNCCIVVFVCCIWTWNMLFSFKQNIDMSHLQTKSMHDICREMTEWSVLSTKWESYLLKFQLVSTAV